MMFGNQNKVMALPSMAGIDPDQFGQINSVPVAPEAFTWGGGGVRMTPEELQLRQADALQRRQTDYSPVSSVWQGLARLSDNLIGGYEQHELGKEAQAIKADENSQIAALLGDTGGGNSPVAAALASSSPIVQKLGQSMYERNNPKPVNNDSAQDWAFYQSQLTPDQFEEWKANRIYSPPHFTMLPNGQMGMVGGYQPPEQQGFDQSTPMGSPLSPPRPVGRLTPINEGGY